MMVRAAKPLGHKSQMISWENVGKTPAREARRRILSFSLNQFDQTSPKTWTPLNNFSGFGQLSWTTCWTTFFILNNFLEQLCWTTFFILDNFFVVHESCSEKLFNWGKSCPEKLFKFINILGKSYKMPVPLQISPNSNFF